MATSLLSSSSEKIMSSSVTAGLQILAPFSIVTGIAIIIAFLEKTDPVRLATTFTVT